MKRLLLLLGLVVAFGLAWNWLDVIDLKVVGQPSMTGPIQSELEKPFFESLREKTGIVPGSEVEFLEKDGRLYLRKVAAVGRGKSLVKRMTGKGSTTLSTDEILALTRGEA